MHAYIHTYIQTDKETLVVYTYINTNMHRTLTTELEIMRASSIPVVKFQELQALHEQVACSSCIHRYVCICMYLCVYTYTYTYSYAHMHVLNDEICYLDFNLILIHTYIFRHMHNTYIYVYIYTHIHTYIYIYTCIYIYIYTYIHTYIYIYIYIYNIHTHTSCAGCF
jgi:hypothetical protein